MADVFGLLIIQLRVRAELPYEPRLERFVAATQNWDLFPLTKFLSFAKRLLGTFVYGPRALARFEKDETGGRCAGESGDG